MKKILINAIAARHGGGQTYLLNLLKNYNSHNVEFQLFIHKAHLNYFSSLDNVTFVNPKIPESNLIIRFFWENFYLPYYIRKNNIDILFAPSGILPKFLLPNSCKYVTVSQNMLPFSPKELKKIDSKLRQFKFLLIKISQIISFYFSDLIIFISEYARTSITAHPLLKLKETIVIPHGIPEIFYPQSLLTKKRPIKERYALYVSTFFEYKSHMEILESWKKLIENPPPDLPEKLLFVGFDKTPYGEKVKNRIKKLKLSKYVLITGSVSYNKLPEYYQHSDFIIFASRCENCPNILLESMASGRPVFCSNYQPMPEFAENTVQYFDPLAPNELYQLITEHLTNPKEEWGKKSQELAKNYTWRNTQSKTWSRVLKL